MAYKSSLFPSGITNLEDNYVSNEDDLEDFLKPEIGRLWGTGNNFSGRIGNNTIINRSSPVQTVASGTWKEIASCGSSRAEEGPFGPGFINNAEVFTAAIKSDGTLWTCGFKLGENISFGSPNFEEFSAANHRSSPVQFGTRSSWKKVSVGSYLSFHGIVTPGYLYGVGDNTFGQLGDNTVVKKSSPIQIGSSQEWKNVFRGGGSAAAIKTNGTLWTWGRNYWGNLGVGDTNDRSSPTQVGTATNWKKVVVGGSNMAAIKNDNTLWMWGDNESGSLGKNDLDDSNSPVQVNASTNIWKDVAIASFTPGVNTPFNVSPSVLAIDSNGDIWGWGRFDYIINETRSSPVQLTSLGSNWKRIHSAGFTYVGIKSDDSLWAWGQNTIGQVGDNTTIDRSSPVQIGQGKTWKKVSVSADAGRNASDYPSAGFFAIEY